MRYCRPGWHWRRGHSGGCVKPVGQDMDQKAANKLVGVERHQLVASVELGPVILPFERHALAIKGDEPAVRNSNPVGVAGQVDLRLWRVQDADPDALEGAP